MPLEDTMQAQIFDGIQSIKSRETKFLLPRKTGPLTETSLRGNMDCMRLLLDLVLRSQSVLLYVHVCRLYNAYRIAALFYLLSKTY